MSHLDPVHVNKMHLSPDIRGISRPCADKRLRKNEVKNDNKCLV